jgi:predicted nuclease with RNAse H fold
MDNSVDTSTGAVERDALDFERGAWSAGTRHEVQLVKAAALLRTLASERDAMREIAQNAIETAERLKSTADVLYESLIEAATVTRVDLTHTLQPAQKALRIADMLCSSLKDRLLAASPHAEK